MESAIRKLIYNIEGYGDKPDFEITNFNQDKANPKKWVFTVIDKRPLEESCANCKHGDTCTSECNTGDRENHIDDCYEKKEGAENESN